jgi:SagB-type dehydrogenase family enzyme
VAVERWIVSTSALVAWRAGRIEITSLVSGATFETDNPDILRVLHAFARATPIDEVLRKLHVYASEEVAACIDELISADILVSVSANDPMTAYQWERSALAFHKKSRQPGFRTMPVHNTAPVAVTRSHRPIPLGRPTHRPPRDLCDVLESRHSSRAWPRRSIARETFSNLLWMSARNRDFAADGPGDAYVSRPYPSGGAAYSLELYPVLASDAVDSIAAGVYRYLPEAHGLEPVADQPTEYLPFLQAAGRSAGSDPPPVVLVITSRFARQSEVYGDLAYSLVLKEVGGLFQTLYLVAECLELGACALGGGIPDELLMRLCGTAELAEPVVGEFMVGCGSGGRDSRSAGEYAQLKTSS